MPKRLVRTAAAPSSQVGTSTHSTPVPSDGASLASSRASSSSGSCRSTPSAVTRRISTSSVWSPTVRRSATSDQWDRRFKQRFRVQNGEMAEEMPVTPRDVGEHAAGVLAPESELFEDLDAAGFGEALAKAMRAGATNPLIPGQAAIQLFADLARVPLATAAQWLGREVEPPVPVDPKDRRFADPAWSTNPWFYGVRLSYLAASRFARSLVGSASLEPDVAQKAQMATELMLNALAPTNFLATNPAALKRAFDTAGMSVAKGARIFFDDLLNNQGRP